MNQVQEKLWRSLPLPARRAAQRTWAGYARLTSGGRVLPHYLIIGTQRGGTTSLYKYLARHPAHPHALAKEVRFFDVNYSRGLGWYRARFPTLAYRRYLERSKGIRMVVGEASPDYVFYPRVPERVARDLPWTKIVVLLRDPAERAWSHYWHQAKRGFESLPFAEAIAREGERLHGETERMQRDETYQSYEWHHHSYLARGLYAEQLRRWLERFPRERILVERSEDLFEDPSAVCRRVLDFLGMPQRELGPYEVFNSFTEQGMDPGIRSELSAYFRPHNRDLVELLGRDIGWES